MTASLLATPRAVPLPDPAPITAYGWPCSRVNEAKAPQPPRTHLSVVRPAYMVLAQFETGRIAAVVTSHPDDWRDEAVRLEHAAFGRYTQFPLANTDTACAALEALAREIRAFYGPECFTMDQRLSKMFMAEWPVVLDAFMRQNGLEVPV